jgi:hypothetical protein
MRANQVHSALMTAGIATAVTSAVALVISKLQTGHASAGLNATSHIAWGDSAALANVPDFKHTAVGAALNTGAMGAWAIVHELLPRARSPLGALAKGALISAAAYVTDYYLVPKRLTPGFEKRFTAGGMLAMYAALAVAFGAGEALSTRRSL